MLPTAGGAPRRLTDHHLGAGAPVWSPDSRRLAYVARVPEEGRYGTVEGVGPGAEPPRLITTLQYRLDDVGFLADRRSQVFVLDLPADFADDAVPRAGAGPGHHRRRRLHRRHLASRRRRARLRLRPPRARRPRPGPRRLRDRARRFGAAPRHRRPAAIAPCPPTHRTGGSSSPRCPTWARTGWTSSPDSRCPAGWTTTARCEPLLDPEQHHRGDETPATVVVDGARARRGAAAGGGRPAPRAAGRRSAGGAGRGPFTVRGVGGRRRRRRRVRGPRPVRRGADRPHPGPAPAAHRVRPSAGGDRPGAPDGGADGDRAGRPSGARLGHHAARARPAPGPADHPRRPVRAVRLDAVRRDPDLRLGRVRRRAVQPARLLGLRRGARPGDPRRRSASSTPPTSSRSSTRRWRTRRSTPTGSGSWAARTAAT